MTPEPEAPGQPPTTERKPWPMSWILIVILVYIALQTGYFLFFAK